MLPQSSQGSEPRKVTVCIPTTGRAELLRESIRSVVEQTYPNVDIVVADNSGSADKQRLIDGVLSEFSDFKITLVRHPTQIEVAANFNSLIDASSGEFWVCVPDDDRLCPGFVARALDALDIHPECDFTFSDHWVIRADGSINHAESSRISSIYGRNLLKEGVYPHERLFELALAQSLCLQAAMFRRSTISSLRFIPGLLALDYSLFLRLGAGTSIHNGYYIDEKLAEYRIHGAQISSTTSRKGFIETTIAALESVQNVPRKHLRSYQRQLGRYYLSLAIADAEAGNAADARLHALRGLRAAPSLRNGLTATLSIALPGAVPLVRRLHQRLRSSLAR
jgi:glycosyltransferase involved in cell wall biosynthesis